jgi:hypothetical protein
MELSSGKEKSPCDAPIYMLFSTENTFTITPLPAPPSIETDEIQTESFRQPKSLIIDKKSLKMIEHGKFLKMISIRHCDAPRCRVGDRDSGVAWRY